MISDPDYARIFTIARCIAWQYGYAAMLHGSATRDLDILLVPWTDRAKNNHDQLVKLLILDAGLKSFGPDDTINWSHRPHGRKSCTLLFPNDRRWVDISIMTAEVNNES